MKTDRQPPLGKNLRLRARIIQAVRAFFIQNDYLEIETPVRLPVIAPEEHIEPFASERWFLQTSPELCMKRLLAAGYSRIFQICKCFRKAERGRKHLPELTMLEWYCTGATYLDLMAHCKDLIRFVARELGSGNEILYQGDKIDLKTPWLRLAVSEAFDRYASISVRDAVVKDRFDEVMVLEIEPNLDRSKPLFLYDYPSEMAALARLKPADNSLAERFELYVGGLELCNGFSELNDPVEQRARFEAELARREGSRKKAYPMPEKFLTALADMPPAAGNALGIDRLVMIFADTADIGDVVAFTPEEL